MKPTGLRRLTAPASGPHTHPVWSPDGREIAFRSGTDFWLIVMAADGTSQRVLLLTGEPRSDDAEPSWSGCIPSRGECRAMIGATTPRVVRRDAPWPRSLPRSLPHGTPSPVEQLSG